MGYVWELYKLALNFCTIEVTFISKSNELLLENVLDPLKLLPVYHSPPPWGKLLVIEPVTPGLKTVVGQVSPLDPFVYTHEQPLEEVGKFEYLPIPSSHDLDIGKTSIDWLLPKFLCSVENYCKLEVKLNELFIAL